VSPFQAKGYLILQGLTLQNRGDDISKRFNLAKSVTLLKFTRVQPWMNPFHCAPNKYRPIYVDEH